MEMLFSYGTLQLENVQKETFGRLLTGTKDVLLGYVLSEIRIKDQDVIQKSGTDIHPILKYTGINSDQVEGTIFQITEDELHQADTYEVDEYTRIKGNFKSGISAWIYADASQFTDSGTKSN
ncbi:gamma-glutamylcyclotransferase family protein [Celerinatantimonas sp. YJH-8]|uniref:gamma-glutamylcyclotransferase family protein n=1 Tax=Celerinatantimonas sp. YJH-8 TaxID=3228714 RepID=UPI0038C45474